MGSVVHFQKREYEAKAFKSGPFAASGTLCGCIDFCGDVPGTWCLTIPEVDELIAMLRAVRDDVVVNSRPFTDPRIIG